MASLSGPIRKKYFNFMWAWIQGNRVVCEERLEQRVYLLQSLACPASLAYQLFWSWSWMLAKFRVTLGVLLCASKHWLVLFLKAFSLATIKQTVFLIILVTLFTITWNYLALHCNREQCCWFIYMWFMWIIKLWGCWLFVWNLQL